MSRRTAQSGYERWYARPAVVAGIGALAVVLAIAINLLQTPTPGDTPAPPPIATVPPASPDAPPAQDVPERPSFDVARINPHGDAVVAGRAAPGATVVLRDGDRELGRVTADGSGEWVFVPESPLAPGPHRLDLDMVRPDGSSVRSEEELLVVVPEPGRDFAGRTTTTETQPLALRMPRDGGPTTVLQNPGAAADDTLVRIETVDADALGRLVVAGRAAPNSRIRVTIDGEVAGEARVGPDGRWRLAPKRAVGEGQHTITADQLDPGGALIARAAVPFTSGGEATDGDGRVVVVRPGENLWRIARSAYGRGTAYTVIYGANRSDIADPDVIYPGQVFRLPERAQN